MSRKRNPRKLESLEDRHLMTANLLIDVDSSVTPAITRYYSDNGTDVIAHNQSGELTGFSPDGRWQSLLVDDQWYLLDTQNSGSTPVQVHGSLYNQSVHNYFQWTERNNYLRFGGTVGGDRIIEEVDPDTGSVFDTALIPISTNGQFRLGESSGTEGLYVVELEGNSPATYSWYFTVLDTSNSQLSVKHAPQRFDSGIFGSTNSQNRWRELYFSEGMFSAHMGDYSMEPGTGGNTGRDVYYSFLEDGTGWQQTSYIDGVAPGSGNSRTEQQAHRTVETINGTTYVAYATWRGSSNTLVVADLQGNEIDSMGLAPGSGENIQHAQFYSHGSSSEIVYSIYDTFSNVNGWYTNLRIESVSFDPISGTLGQPTIIADTSGSTFSNGSFETNSKPFTDGLGKYCWSSNEHYTPNSSTTDLLCTDLGSPTKPLPLTANGERERHGSVAPTTNGYLNTHESDNVVEAITEVNGRLNHIWEFDVPSQLAGESVTVLMEARTSADDEDFRWAYTEELGTNWTSLGRIDLNAENIYARQITLPTIPGSFYIRVIDSDSAASAPSDNVQSTLAVDRLALLENSCATVYCSVADIQVLGNPVDNHTHTHASDNVEQQLQESGGRLQHIWALATDVSAAGSNATLSIEARTSGTEFFRWAYSLDRINWNHNGKIDQQNEQTYSKAISLPTNFDGTLYVRVIDSVMANDTTTDSLFVDSLELTL